MIRSWLLVLFFYLIWPEGIWLVLFFWLIYFAAWLQWRQPW